MKERELPLLILAFVLTVCDLPLQVTAESSLFEHRKSPHSFVEFFHTCAFYYQLERGAHHIFYQEIHKYIPLTNQPS